jgi:hypothetical protein
VSVAASCDCSSSAVVSAFVFGPGSGFAAHQQHDFARRADLGIEFILVSNAGASPDGLSLGSSLVSTLAASQVSESKSSLAANLALGTSQLAACNCVSESSESKSCLAAYLERGDSQLAARKCDSESKSSLAAHLEHGASQLAARKFRSLGVSESKSSLAANLAFGVRQLAACNFVASFAAKKLGHRHLAT